MRMMGERATASAGAVIAHHQTPFTAVRRALTSAEERAKAVEGKDAFTITIVKRSGGDVHFTAHWTAMPLLERLIAFLSEKAVSRRAVYHSLEWLAALPKQPPQDMLAGLLTQQLERQCEQKSTRDHHDLPGLSGKVATHVSQAEQPLEQLAGLLATAEFLARESRAEATGTRRGDQGEALHA